MNCDPKSTFQFRNKKYNVGEVIDAVLEKVNTEYCQKKYQSYLDRNPFPSPPSKEHVRMFGEYVVDQHNERVTFIKRSAVREVMNCGFNPVLSGGSRSNLEFLPTRPTNITKDHVCDMLNVIRGNRKKTVGRNWSSRS